MRLQLQRNVHPSAFRTAWREWKFCTADQRLHLWKINDLVCPACSDGCAGVHVDGNMKLFTWLRAREPWRPSHFAEFFLADSVVKERLETIDSVTGQQVRPCSAGTRVVLAMVSALDWL